MTRTQKGNTTERTRKSEYSSGEAICKIIKKEKQKKEEKGILFVVFHFLSHKQGSTNRVWKKRLESEVR